MGATELLLHFGRDDDVAEQGWQNVSLTDGDQVCDKGRVTDDDHGPQSSRTVCKFVAKSSRS